MARTPHATPWWRRLVPLPASSPTHDGAVAAERARVAASAARLREVLREERHRLRPDAWELVSRCQRLTEELVPTWETYARTRPGDATALAALLELRLEPAVRDFLALPDSRKPHAADALAAVLREDAADAARLHRRLSAVVDARLRGRAEGT